MEQLACISPLIYSNPRPFSGWTLQWIDKMPAILDSLFHKVVNTTSTPIGVEGGVWWVATKWRGIPV